MTSARSTSIFREVAHDIRAKIEDGTYPLGQKLPTEVELAEQYGVTRVTVNRALRILVAEGWVRVHRGVGTIVRDIMPIVRDASVRHSKTRRERGGARGAFASELAERDLSYDTRNIIDRVAPPKRVADLLGVSSGEVSTVMRARYMKIVPAPGARHVPYQIAISYIPLSIAEGTQIEDEDTGVGGISSRLADLGQRQKRLTETISVRPPEPDEIEFLSMTEDQRVFDIQHVTVNEAGEPVKVTLYVIPTHMSILRYTIELED
ncbi:GntR family transcriptional regulator [Nonomuraea wenchangensis]|uniref:GntR family transcriptional regulator n=1 Tax=Nonomuraea wenchangensis TaxID=568860 RepID=A0A1I0LUZ0_9ACTN|nr:GntR family transcriptional regulator [Nonomuraea wenchangensis]SEU46678.1 GntR family transcriptional regulator [Nonomuraea wenchangensis]